MSGALINNKVQYPDEPAPFFKAIDIMTKHLVIMVGGIGVANYGIDKDNIDAYEYSNGYYQKAGDEESFKELYRLSELSSDEDAYHSLLISVPLKWDTNGYK